MSTADKQIRRLVETFVRDLEALVRQAALESVSEALGGATRPKRAPTPATRAVGTPKKGSQPGKGGPSAKSEKGAKKEASEGERRGRRSPRELEAIAATILGYVKANPGQRAEQIKAALRIDAADWSLPVKKLLDERRLVTRGQKRSTSYELGPAANA